MANENGSRRTDTGFWNTFTFGKWVISIAFFTGINIAVIQSHMTDKSIHVSLQEKSQLVQIEKYGFTFSQAEKSDVVARLLVAEKEIISIQKKLDLYRVEGRLQTPRQKAAQMESVIRKVIKEELKNGK